MKPVKKPGEVRGSAHLRVENGVRSAPRGRHRGGKGRKRYRKMRVKGLYRGKDYHEKLGGGITLLLG